MEILSGIDTHEMSRTAIFKSRLRYYEKNMINALGFDVRVKLTHPLPPAYCAIVHPWITTFPTCRHSESPESTIVAYRVNAFIHNKASQIVHPHAEYLGLSFPTYLCVQNQPPDVTWCILSAVRKTICVYIAFSLRRTRLVYV